MLDLFLGGMYLGLILSITLGPAFFTIIQTSIDRGFISAFLISLGVLISDIVLIIISFMGISTIINTGNNQSYMAIVAGLILICFGIYTFLKKPEILKRREAMLKDIKSSNPSFITFLGKGFLLNVANPFLWIFWVIALTGLSNQSDPENFRSVVITFFSGTLLVVFSFDILKSFIGIKIKKYLKLRTQLIINRLVGISLILFGVILLIRTFIF